MLLIENYRDDVLYPTYDMEKRKGNIKTIKTIQ